jgi:hypothetical protein
VMVELVALLPAFQLKFLMTRAGRRAFGRPGPATAPGAPATGHAGGNE